MLAWGINNVALGMVFIVFAIQCLILTRQVNLRRKQETNEESKTHFKEGVFNGVLMAAILGAIGLIYVITGAAVLLFNNTKSGGLGLLYPIPTDSFAIYFLSFLIIFIGAFVIYEYFTKKSLKNPQPEQKIHKLDLEVSRKAFHVLIIGILAVYLVVGTLVTDSLYQYLTEDVYVPLYGFVTGDTNFIDSGRLWTMFGVTAVFEFCFLTDLIRIKAPRWYPARMISNMYREKEKETLGPHIYLVGGILFAIIVFPAPVAMAVIAVSGLGDATATIVGVTKGKHKIRPTISKKSWEGCIAGMLASFIFGFIAFIAVAFKYYGEVSDIGSIISTGLIVSAIAVPVFFAIDYFTPTPLPFSDNLLNPLLIGFAMWGAYSLCGL
ncbi:MAG: hypothetical protein LUQ65_11530 [Candidatus Helarchaeota archaeon]|nr:hypothetical protein [Candidatus Helarchaeota archaeon]